MFTKVGQSAFYCKSAFYVYKGKLVRISQAW